jgi:hypothetical protein
LSIPLPIPARHSAFGPTQCAWLNFWERIRTSAFSPGDFEEERFVKGLTIASIGVVTLIAVSLSAQEKKSDWQKEFAGLPWGSTLAEIKAAQPKVNCITSFKTEQSAGRGTVCTFPPTTGSLRLRRKVWVVGGQMSRAMVIFEQGDYKEIRQLLVEKYGPPTKSDAYSERWEGPTVVATFDGLGGFVPTVTLATRVFVDNENKEAAAKNEKTKEKF